MVCKSKVNHYKFGTSKLTVEQAHKSCLVTGLVKINLSVKLTPFKVNHDFFSFPEITFYFIFIIYLISHSAGEDGGTKYKC